MSTITCNPNSDLVAFAEVIIAAEQSGVLEMVVKALSNATDNTPAPMPATVRKPKTIAQSTPKVPARTVKAADKSDFWSGPATSGQLRRINRAEMAIDKHEGETSALSTLSSFDNARDASDYYNELKLDMSDYGIKF